MIWLYTDTEGGVWQAWPCDRERFIPCDEDLAKIKGTKSYYSNTVVIHGVTTHCFQTFLGTIWDCINGWRVATP